MPIFFLKIINSDIDKNNNPNKLGLVYNNKPMKTIYRVFFIALFTLLLGALIFYAKGYRLDLDQGKITGTGILSINSVPKNSRVYLDDKLIGVTDININLEPNKYKLKVESESPNYNTWEKEIFIEKELVISLHAHLFLKNPGLKPLSSIGIKKIQQIDDIQQYILLAYDPEIKSDVLYLLNLETPVISLNKKLEILATTQELLSTPEADLSKLKIKISPDFTQLLLNYNQTGYLITISSKEVLKDINVDSIEEQWKKEQEKQKAVSFRIFPKEFQKEATSSVEIISIAPDETKILYKAKKNTQLPRVINPPIPLAQPDKETRKLKKGGVYIYDKKQDHNFKLNLNPDADYLNQFVKWHPDSLHLFFFDKNQVKIIDLDGENLRTIYAGPFENEILSVNKKGNIILLINLNNQNNLYPDLYEIEIN